MSNIGDKVGALTDVLSDIAPALEKIDEVLIGVEQSLDAIKEAMAPRFPKMWEYVYAESLRQMDALGHEGWRFKADMSYVHTDGRREPMYLMEREVPS